MQTKVIDIEVIDFLASDRCITASENLDKIINFFRSNKTNSILSCLIEKKLRKNQIAIPQLIRNYSQGIRATLLTKQFFLKKIKSDLERENCRIYLLKGMAFNNNIYSTDFPRGCSDIDILVHPTDLNKIKKILNHYATEFLQRNKKPFSNSYETTWLTKGAPLVQIDLHWGLLPPNENQLQIDELVENSIPHPFYKSDKIHCLSKYHNVVHLLLHMYKDANLLQQSLMDYKTLTKNLTKDDWQEINTICKANCIENIINFMTNAIKNLNIEHKKTISEKLISTNNRLPLKTKKLFLKFKLKKNTGEFISYLYNYILSFFKR